jgi:hypothetical protein
MRRTETELNRVSYEIRGGAISIHRCLGPGCFESAYAPCLAYELTKRKLEFRAKVPLTLQYETVVVPGAAPIHIRQLQTYLRLSGCPLGLILNFGAILMTGGIERQVNNFPEGTAPHTDPSP